MYFEYFGLTENPFSIAPNPDYLFLSDRHKEAQAHLNFGLGETGGFVLLTGEVGTGKTTVLRNLLRQLGDDSQVAMILNPSLSERELLASICDELEIDYDQQQDSLKLYSDAIKQRLMDNHQAGKHTLLLIDEAQHLGVQALEQLRLLTNLETDTQKLLRVVLVGQPELQQMLKQSMLRQLAQRITARYHLLPLTLAETRQYIRYRLKVAGCQRKLFSDKSCKRIFQLSGGIPRLINLLCDRALLASYAADQELVEPKAVQQAAGEIGLEGVKAGSGNNLGLGFAAGVVLALGVAGALAYLSKPPVPSAIEPTLQPALELNPIVAEPVVTAAPEQHQLVEAEPAVSVDNQWRELRQANLRPDIARQTLYKLWGYQVEAQQANCQLAPAVGLRCQRQQGGWNALLALNYPAVIALNDEGQRFFAVVTQLEPEVELWLDSQRIVVEPSWLLRRWDGEFELMWYPPRGFSGVLKQGERGPMVEWLSQSLAMLNGGLAGQSSVFDGELAQQVRSFQRQNLLEADGVVGEQTMMRLSQLVHLSQPRLKEVW